jgi:hypothetical protein
MLGRAVFTNVGRCARKTRLSDSWLPRCLCVASCKVSVIQLIKWIPVLEPLSKCFLLQDALFVSAILTRQAPALYLGGNHGCTH